MSDTEGSALSSGIVRKARPWAGALVYVLGMAVVLGLLVLMVQTYGLTETIRESQKTNTGTSEAILSCTDPEGECSKRNAKATATAVDDIAHVSIIAAACADLPGPQNAQTIEACVRAEVERRKDADN